MEQLGIEYVCTANGGRSPQAQTIGRDHVKERGLERQVNIYSSGSAAEAVNNLDLPMIDLIGYIEAGLEGGAFMGKACRTAEYLVKNKQKMAEAAENGDSSAREMIRFCNNYLMADEVAKRNIVLLEMGLAPEGHFHEQTAVRDDVQLILTMKESNAQAVRKIYEGSGRSPIIMPVCEYAGIEGSIADPFGKLIEAWRETRDQIKEAVARSIDRAVEKYLR